MLWGVINVVVDMKRNCTAVGDFVSLCINTCIIKAFLFCPINVSFMTINFEFLWMLAYFWSVEFPFMSQDLDLSL